MDEEGRPSTWWARLVFPLFQARPLGVVEWRLGLVVIGIALLFAWLIWWTFIPGLIGEIFLGIYHGGVWIAGLFAGGGGSDVATPVLTQVPGRGGLASPVGVAVRIAITVALAAPALSG